MAAAVGCRAVRSCKAGVVVSLDFRTRTEDDIAAVDTDEFFGAVLPDLAASHLELAAAGARELGVEPFTIETPSGAWTLALDGDRLMITRDDTGRQRVHIEGHPEVLEVSRSFAHLFRGS